MTEEAEEEAEEVFRVYSAVSIHQLYFEVTITFWAFHQFWAYATISSENEINLFQLAFPKKLSTGFFSN